jgi:hypothetical protein
VAKRQFKLATQTSVESKAPPDVVYDTVADLKAHLVWMGERARDDWFKLLSLNETGDGPAVTGTTFTSSGANYNGTFHDSSVVAEASRPTTFVIETDARLDRKHGRALEAHFTHRYDIEPTDAGSRITYIEEIGSVNYVPYWLQFWSRPITRRLIDRGVRRQLQNLAQLAEERGLKGHS